MFEGTVEVLVPPPIEQARTMGLHRHLKAAPQVESVDVRVSGGAGITITVVLREPTRLLRVLRSSPDVETIGFPGGNSLCVTLVPEAGDADCGPTS
jgi:hypothetical protein